MSILVFVCECIILNILKEQGIDPISNILASFFIILFSIALIFDLCRSSVLESFSNSILLGYLLRVGLLYFDRFGQWIYYLPNSGADSETFYYNALWQATGQPYRRSASFITLFKYVFSIIGTNRLMGQFIILLFSIVSLVFLAMALSFVDVEESNKIRVMRIVALLPNYAILSSIFLRESIVCMFITISLFFFIRYLYGFSLINVILATLAVFLGMIYHSGVAGIIIGYLVVLVIFDRERNTFRLSSSNMFVAMILGVFFAYLYIKYGDVLFSKFANVDSLSDIANTSEYGGTSYARYVGNSGSIYSMALFTIPRFMFFLFSPFPWQWRGIKDIIAFMFSSMYYLSAIIALFKYLKKGDAQNKNVVIVLSIIAFCVIFIFAWGTANTGTAARHREKIVSLIALILANCLSVKEGNNKSFRYIYKRDI